MRPAALATAAKVIEAEYASPYLNHATMEPQVCTAWIKPDGFVEVWTSTQNGEAALAEAARTAGVPQEKVEVHKMMLGGGFGRRGATQDYVRQGVKIAMAMPGKPVKLMWSREEDMQHGFYRPASLVKLRGGLDAQGNVRRLRGEDRLPVDPRRRHAGRAQGRRRLHRRAHAERHALRRSPTSTSATRCATATCPWASGARRGSRTASTASASSTSWRRPPARIRSRSASRCSRPATRTASCSRRPPRLRAGARRCRRAWAGASRWWRASAATPPAWPRSRSTADGALKVLRYVVAIDSGHVVNPDTCAAQAESNAIYGLGALFEANTVKDGRIQESNFHDFPLPDDRRHAQGRARPRPHRRLLGRPRRARHPALPGRACSTPSSPSPASAIRTLPLRKEDLKARLIRERFGEGGAGDTSMQILGTQT